MKLLIMQSSPCSCHFLFGLNILLSTLFSNTLNICSSLTVRYQVSHPYKTRGKIKVFLYIFELLSSGEVTGKQKILNWMVGRTPEFNNLLMSS
jgi:hypothetical protein